MANIRILLEQKKSVEPPIKKQRTEAGSSRGSNSIDHNPTAAGEAMPVYFPRGLSEIVLGYLDSDINPIQQRDEHAEYPSQSYARFKLFGRTLEDLMSDEAAMVG